MNAGLNPTPPKGLDAFNKTPILDIKPYTGHPRGIINNFKVPYWEQR